MKKLVKVYAVMLIQTNSMKAVFTSEDKKSCEDFKRNNKNIGKLGVAYVKNMWKEV